MSAGQNLRRGYAYGVHATAHSGASLERRGSPDIVSLVVMATIVFVIVAIASDPVLAATVGRMFGTAWSDSLAFLMGLMGRAG
jgi:hypothetical protein